MNVTSLLQNMTSESHTLLRGVKTCHNSLPISAMFGTTHLHITTFNIYMFCEIQKGEGRTFLKGKNEIILARKL